jgi:D-3-phosphoglycerate dehydrogenase
MPEKGAQSFAALKKAYSKGVEIQGRTLGVIGFGRIGQAVAQMALGAGMKVIATDPVVNEAVLNWEIPMYGKVDVRILTRSMNEVLESSDFTRLRRAGRLLVKQRSTS